MGAAARSHRSERGFVANSIPEGSAARSRPLAEGCNLALLESKPIRSAAGFFVPDQSRNDWRAAASARRRPATRVPQVRFERALRRLRPES